VPSFLSQDTDNQATRYAAVYSPVPLSATSVFLLPAWRRMVVPENITWGKLHMEIQFAMDSGASEFRQRKS
jgi:hypothetical protein